MYTPRKRSPLTSTIIDQPPSLAMPNVTCHMSDPPTPGRGGAPRPHAARTHVSHMSDQRARARNHPIACARNHARRPPCVTPRGPLPSPMHTTTLPGRDSPNTHINNTRHAHAHARAIVSRAPRPRAHGVYQSINPCAHTYILYYNISLSNDDTHDSRIYNPYTHSVWS